MLLHLWHMEGPRLRVELELQLPAYTKATAPWDPSHVCNLPQISWQRQILNPLSEARHQTRNLMVPSRIRFHCAMTGTPELPLKHFQNSVKNNFIPNSGIFTALAIFLPELQFSDFLAKRSLHPTQCTSHLHHSPHSPGASVNPFPHLHLEGVLEQNLKN